VEWEGGGKIKRGYLGRKTGTLVEKSPGSGSTRGGAQGWAAEKAKGSKPPPTCYLPGETRPERRHQFVQTNRAKKRKRDLVRKKYYVKKKRREKRRREAPSLQKLGKKGRSKFQRS